MASIYGYFRIEYLILIIDLWVKNFSPKDYRIKKLSAVARKPRHVLIQMIRHKVANLESSAPM